MLDFLISSLIVITFTVSRDGYKQVRKPNLAPYKDINDLWLLVSEHSKVILTDDILYGNSGLRTYFLDN